MGKDYKLANRFSSKVSALLKFRRARGLRESLLYPN